jgi:lysophospholipase L1-like esterase
MKPLTLAVGAILLAGLGLVGWKAFRYRKDAQTWHSRWETLHGNPGARDRYADDNARLRRAGASPHRVIFLGASITESLDFQQLFPGQNFVNRGIGGQLVWQQVLRVEPDALDLNPEAVVIKMCAINLLPDAPPLEETQYYFAMLADTIRRRGVKVIQATAVPVTRAYDRTEGDGHVTERLTRFNAWVRDQVRAHNDMLLDYSAALADEEGYLPDSLSDDGLHPNDAGKRRMAAAIRAAIVEGRGQPQGVETPPTPTEPTAPAPTEAAPTAPAPTAPGAAPEAPPQR